MLYKEPLIKICTSCKFDRDWLPVNPPVFEKVIGECFDKLKTFPEEEQKIIIKYHNIVQKLKQTETEKCSVSNDTRMWRINIDAFDELEKTIFKPKVQLYGH